MGAWNSSESTHHLQAPFTVENCRVVWKRKKEKVAYQSRVWARWPPFRSLLYHLVLLLSGDNSSSMTQFAWLYYGECGSIYSWPAVRIRGEVVWAHLIQCMHVVRINESHCRLDPVVRKTEVWVHTKGKGLPRVSVAGNPLQLCRKE